MAARNFVNHSDHPRITWIRIVPKPLKIFVSYVDRMPISCRCARQLYVYRFTNRILRSDKKSYIFICCQRNYLYTLRICYDKRIIHINVFCRIISYYLLRQTRPDMMPSIIYSSAIPCNILQNDLSCVLRTYIFVPRYDT